MTTVATLHTDLLEVNPGEEASCALDIRNASDIVESYELEVLGDAAAWTVPEPAAVSVYPGDATRVIVLFRPPRSGRVLAGDVPFAVRVTPSQQPDTAAVPEGIVRVLPFAETTAEIRPRTSKGRRSARHEVAVDNRGNIPVQVGISGTDPDDALAVTARPAALAVGPGQAVFTKIRVRHRRRLWRGHPETRPFQVLVAPEGAPPVTLDANTVQVPVIPAGAGRVLAVLAALLLLGSGLWFGMLKPAVTSAARQAVAEAVEEPLAEIAGQAGQAAADAASAQSAVDEALGDGVQPTLVVEPPPPPGTEVFRHRFETTVAAGGTATSEPLVAPEETTLVITDLILQNPQGDTGRLDILVDGGEVHTEALQNFRSFDYHLVTPIEVPAGQPAAIQTRCVEAGPALAPFTAASCRVFVLVIGYQRVNPPPSEAVPATGG